MTAKAKTPKPAKSIKPINAAKPADAPKRERKARKPPLARAELLHIRLAKNLEALAKNVRGWRGESTADQADLIAALIESLEDMETANAVVSANLSGLRRSGYAPKGPAPGRKPLAAGTEVMLRANRYDPEIHGANAFEVIAVHAKLIQIRATGDLKAQSHYVPRNWLSVRDDTVDDTPAGEDD